MQTDYNIANQPGASFRSDLNDTLESIVSNNSGATQPDEPFAYMWWMDTNANILKQRNPGNTAWISKLKIYNSYVNVDNTSDANKPVSSAGQTALNAKANQTTTYTKIETDNLKAAISGQTFTGNISAPNLSGTNTGDQDLSGKANVSGQNFTGAISANNLSGTNNGDQTNITGNAGTVSNISTAQVGGATAGLSAGAVGSYVFARSTRSLQEFGNTQPGSDLSPSNANGRTFSGTLPGTWRLMGAIFATSYDTEVTSLYLRIS